MEQLTIPLQIKPELNIFKITLDDYSSVKAQLKECFDTINYKIEDESLSLTYIENATEISFTVTDVVFNEYYSFTETYSNSYFYILFITKYGGDVHIRIRDSIYPKDISYIIKELDFELTQDDLTQISFFNK